MCQIDFEVNLSVYENKSFEIIEDMYGIRNTIDFSSKKVFIPSNFENVREKVSLSEKILIENQSYYKDRFKNNDSTTRPKNIRLSTTTIIL